jgi:hypothetical protein
MRPEILSRLRAVAGDAAPRALGFVVGPVPDTVELPPPPSAATGEAGAPRLATAAVAAAAGGIPDRELRTRFLDVAGRYIARFGGGQGSGEGSGSATG